MKNLLYLMHVQWGWIKQRPHFIAEHLTAFFDVTVPFHKAYAKQLNVELIKPHHKDLHFIELFKLPHLNLKWYIKINELMITSQIRSLIPRYDYIWVTHPYLFRQIKGSVPNYCKVVYDCMDDALEFPAARTNPLFSTLLLEAEKDLIRRSDVIFTSSEHLRQKLLQRHQPAKNIMVINNAISIEECSHPPDRLPLQIETLLRIPQKKFTYLGTISEWLDFGLIEESLDKFKDIVYLFFGPNEIPLPSHKRIIHGGCLEHRFIGAVMEESNALIMPFRINELVLSVNPVKLYEYIFSCKPAVAVAYDETSRFEKFVYLYRSKEEFFSFIENITNGTLGLKENCEEHRRFAADNTWEKRVKVMAARLMEGSKS